VPNKPPSPLPDEGSDSVFYEIPRSIEFVDPFPRASQEQAPDSEMRIVVPEGALPSIHKYMDGWIEGDSLRLGFSTGHGGVTVELEGGVAMELGRPLPQSVRTAPTRLLDLTRVVGRTTGAFATTDSIEIETSTDPWGNPDVELVTQVDLSYPREDYQRLSARFREMFGSPDRDAPDESEPTLRWRNRITELWLWVTGRRAADFRTLVSLRARNF